MPEEESQSLDRPQRRLLRRIYNGRTTPVMANERAFLTFREASRYLLSLPADERETAYAQMKAFALSEGQSDGDA